MPETQARRKGQPGQPTIWFMSGGRFVSETTQRSIDTSRQVRRVLRDSR